MIESNHNEVFKKLLSLTASKGLKAEGLFFLSGEKLVREFLNNPSHKIVYEVLHSKLSPLQHNVGHIELTSALFQQLDVLGTHFNLFVLEQPLIETLPEKLENYKPEGIELVLPIGDPGNLGALIRSCEAFGVSKVILTREAAHPFLPKCVKASAGSVLRVPFVHGPSLAAFPKSSIALDKEGIPIDQFVWPQNVLLLVGEEGPGFRAECFTSRICIPTKGVESLNVVVAASIALSRIPR